MAFRATTVVTQEAFDVLRRRVLETKNFLTGRRAVMLSTSPADVPLTVVLHLGRAIADLTSLATTPGLVDYAKSQVDDPAYDVVAEFTAMRAAMVACRDGLISTFPKDGSDFLLYQTFNANGSLATRTFTAAQMAGSVALIDAVLATIN
jgi:hypothetical protein